MKPVVDTPRRSTITTYHGIDVTEDYRWLEDTDDEETRHWTSAQAEHTRAYLDALPDRAAVGDRVRELLAAESVDYDRLRKAGAHYFALKRQPPLQQPFLVVRD